MSATETTIQLAPSFFGPADQPFVQQGELSASLFTYPSGVAAVRLVNARGELVMLPYQGQQIWSAAFDGRNITMRSMFDQPNATRNYLETYGGFLLHCGVTAMGVPAEGDTHPLHGELPNAPYQKAWLVLGEDERGAYIGLGGEYRHTVAFSFNYVAHPLVKLYAGEGRCTIDLSVTNLKRTPMEFMYLAHVNFRPVPNGKLVYSAHAKPENVRVRQSIPSHVQTGPGYREFLDELAQNPAKHHILAPDLAFDPEVVLTIDYAADAQGWSHTLQVHDDGSADYIAHRPDQLDKGVRWISITPDQAALGMVLPATAEPEGYQAEKAKGNIRTLDGGATFHCSMEAGVLTPDETEAMTRHIEQILGAS